MRTGDCGRVRGFTYLWLLFVLAMGGALLATIGQRWSGVVQRDREHELLFRGAQIAAAIAAYRAAPGVSPPQWPAGFDVLVEDRRSALPRRHLRRVYIDPFTGAPDWEPIYAEDGGWRGVRSRSGAVAMILTAARPEGAAPPQRVSDHLFVAVVPMPTASAAMPADARASEPK